jgi:hypothetical protein
MENSHLAEENKYYEMQKPQMQNTKDEEQMEDPMVNKILFFHLHMTNTFVSNNYRGERFGMQRFEDDLLRVLTESRTVFTQSSRLFAQSPNLLA